MMCPQEQGGLSQCGHIADKEEGVFFRDFVRMSFMDFNVRVSNIHLREG